MDQLRVPAEQFMPADLSLLDHLPVGRRFDLAICLEVAEHLSQTAAEKLVKFLTGHADRVLFSAAVPCQGGTHHINEQWQSYWAEIFVACGFDAFDVVRPRIAGNREIEYWYRQNTVLYVKCGSDLATTLTGSAMPKALDYILPELFEAKLKQLHQPKLRELIRRIPSAFMNDIRRKFL
jgi:hypothetical protein